MFRGFVNTVLKAVYFVLLVILVLIIYFAIMIGDGQSINVPIFIVVLIVGIMNLAIMVILQKYLRNLSLGGLSSNEQYKYLKDQLSGVESHILKGLNQASYEKAKKEYEDLYVQQKKGNVVQVSPEKETVEAEIVEKDDSFQEFDHNLEEYATIAKAAMEAEEEQQVAEQVDLKSMTVPELKKLCKEHGIKGYSTMKKAELVDMLTLVLNGQE